ncbi:hypothetical protein Tco_0352356 [Tanacetum coccineum]
MSSVLRRKTKKTQTARCPGVVAKGWRASRQNDEPYYVTILFALECVDVDDDRDKSRIASYKSGFGELNLISRRVISRTQTSWDLVSRRVKLYISDDLTSSSTRRLKCLEPSDLSVLHKRRLAKETFSGDLKLQDIAFKKLNARKLQTQECKVKVLDASLVFMKSSGTISGEENKSNSPGNECNRKGNENNRSGNKNNRSMYDNSSSEKENSRSGNERNRFGNESSKSGNECNSSRNKSSNSGNDTDVDIADIRPSYDT